MTIVGTGIPAMANTVVGVTVTLTVGAGIVTTPDTVVAAV